MLALEVVPLPVTDVDRALAFYVEQAGFALDVDYRPAADFRVVQLTPRGSSCSIQLVMADSPWRVRNLYLVTNDIADARANLINRGVAVGPIRHKVAELENPNCVRNCVRPPKVLRSLTPTSDGLCGCGVRLREHPFCARSSIAAGQSAKA
jgi:hypothetical protein